MKIGLSPSKLYASVLELMGRKSCDANMEIRYVNLFNNKDMRLIQSKLYASVLDFTEIKSQWYVDIFLLHTNTSSVVID